MINENKIIEMQQNLNAYVIGMDLFKICIEKEKIKSVVQLK